MTKRFMLMLIIGSSADAGYISLVPRGRHPGPGPRRAFVSARRIDIPARKEGGLPALVDDYGAGASPEVFERTSNQDLVVSTKPG